MSLNLFRVIIMKLLCPLVVSDDAAYDGDVFLAARSRKLEALRANGWNITIT